MNITDPIRKALEPGEQVIWSGQPRKGLAWRAGDVLGIPVGILVLAFSFFWMNSAAKNGASAAFVLFGLPFVLVGIHMLIGRFFVDAKRRSVTHYALTPKRVIICSGVWMQSVKSLPLKSLSEMSLSERDDGTGTITFGSPVPVSALWRSTTVWPAAGFEQAVPPCFDLIDAARAVYEQLRRAQASA